MCASSLEMFSFNQPFMLLAKNYFDFFFKLISSDILRQMARAE